MIFDEGIVSYNVDNVEIKDGEWHINKYNCKNNDNNSSKNEGADE